MALGALSGAFGSVLISHRREITVVMGSLVILLGLAFVGLVPWLQRDVRVHSVPAVGLAAAPLLGFLFGLGWTPCIGPTLGAILTLSINEATVARGAVLSGVYALGLGLPFVLAGLAYRRALGAFGFVRRHQAWVTRLGGVMLILVGVLLVTGWWDWMVNWMQVAPHRRLRDERLMTSTRMSTAPTAPHEHPQGHERAASCCAGRGASSPRCAPR